MKIRVPLLVAVVPVAVAAALAVILAAGSSQASPAGPLRPITPATPIAEVARHFGRPTSSRTRGGSLTNVYVAKLHDRTIVVYYHLRPRPNP